MELIKKMMPALISVVAIVISSWSLYVTSLKDADISLSVGEAMQIWHNDAGQLSVDLPIIFHNSGSRSGVVRSLGIVLKEPNSEEAIFVKWLGFKSFRDDIGGNSSWVYESQRTPIAVPPGGEVSKMVSFWAGPAGAGWIPKPLTYELHLLAWDRAGESPPIRKKLSWTFSPEHVSRIQARYDERKRIGQWVLHSAYAAESRKLTTLEFNQLTR